MKVQWSIDSLSRLRVNFFGGVANPRRHAVTMGSLARCTSRDQFQKGVQRLLTILGLDPNRVVYSEPQRSGNNRWSLIRCLLTEEDE